MPENRQPSRYRLRPPEPTTVILSEEGAAAAGYVTAPSRPRMLEALPAAYLETRPPLMYRLVAEAETIRSGAHAVESETYRAKAFACSSFYKAISRCLIEWEV